jgi:H+/Cl- antiporter ClcA
MCTLICFGDQKIRSRNLTGAGAGAGVGIIFNLHIRDKHV